MASKIFKIPEGNGLVDVLDIRASVLDSITWLNPFEDPVINIPPIINSKKTIEDKLPPASKYPKKALITTRLESLSFKREIYPLILVRNDNFDTVSNYNILFFTEISTNYSLNWEMFNDSINNLFGFAII